MRLADNRLEARTRERLARLAGGGLLRTLRPPAGIDLSSNDYLNLSRHPRLLERFAAAVAREGCGSTGSRLLRGERDAFAAVERRFAAFKRTDRALYFSSGYLANVAVLTTLADRSDTIFSDERNHASLIDGARLSRARTVVFPHNDANRLEELLAADGPSAPEAVRFVVAESLFSMDGDVAPLALYASLCQRYGAVLVVDEAHAVGVYGARGSGLLEEAGVEAASVISINTAGKALGVAGAFVAGPAWVVDYLIQRARTFVFSTAPPPAIASALDASLTLVEAEPQRRQRLRTLARTLRDRLSAAGVPVPDGASQIIPIVLGTNDRATAVAARLQADGFDVRAIRPPSVPEGTARLRVSLNAALDDAILDRFADALAKALAIAPRECQCSTVSS